MSKENYLEDLFHTTIRIETDTGQGTGVFVTVGGSQVFLATNRHVVEGSSHGCFLFTHSDTQGRPILGRQSQLNVGGDAWQWTFHPDDGVDIAVYPMSSLINHVRSQGVDPMRVSIPVESFPSDEELDTVPDIAEVVFLGYPVGIYDRVNNIPVVRTGTTATPVTIDYESRPVFLIDASIYPGSSGSPVFLYNTAGIWRDRDGTLEMARISIKFLGLVASVFLHKDNSPIRVEEMPAQLRAWAETTQMIDLGFVYKARTIKETIDLII